MNLQEYRMLQGEKGAIEKMLTEIPEDHIIDRMGLESRITEIDETLAAQPVPAREPVRARLTFRGKPIVGSYGMFAEFGALVVGAFSEAIAAIGASQAQPLGSRGVLPSRDDFRMLITGTAPGSFGFELEEAPLENPERFAAESPLEPAIHQAKAIMKASLGTDDELTEALSETDPRALDAIRKFFDTMVKSDAICALDFKGDVFRFADVEQVRRSVNRLEQDNIHEYIERLVGSFLGVLPNRRTFEFRVSETDAFIAGRVGKEIADASLINRVIEKPVVINVQIRQVGEGRARYILVGYEESTGGE